VRLRTCDAAAAATALAALRLARIGSALYNRPPHSAPEPVAGLPLRKRLASLEVASKLRVVAGHLGQESVIRESPGRAVACINFR